MKKSTLLIIAMFALILNAKSQISPSTYTPVRKEKVIKLAGPRAGLTYIGGELGQRMKDLHLSQYISQVGWQFETRFFETRDGLQGLIETVILLGAVETAQPVLSASVLVGFRTRHGFEAGIGPNISTAAGGSSSLVIAIGHTVKNDDIYIPVNFAIVPGASAVKYTFLIGFILRRDRD